MKLRPIIFINLVATSAWLGAVLLIGGCGYVKLLRPNVLKQLNPRVVAPETPVGEGRYKVQFMAKKDSTSVWLYPMGPPLIAPHIAPPAR